MSSNIEAQIEKKWNTEERTNLIFQVISTYSPSKQEKNVAKIIFDYLKKKKMSPRIDSAGNVVCEFGNGNYSILLCGHMDTVPGQLPVKLEGDWVFGRGACDAKGALLSLLFAFEDLAKYGEKIEGKVIFAGVTEEEQSSSGLAELIRGNMKAGNAIFGEPGGVSKITVGYRGHLTLRISIVTPEVHASAPKLVTNSAELLFEIYRSVKDSLGAENDGSLDPISASITEISSGTAHNVLPGKTNATIDVRVPLGKTTGQIIDVIQTLVDSFRPRFSDAIVTVTFDEPTEPYRVPFSSSLVRAMNRSILRTKAKPSLITKSGTGDMNTYAIAFGVDAITYGPGEARLSHTSEEKVTMSEIFACADIVSNATLELFEMNRKKYEFNGSKLEKMANKTLAEKIIGSHTAEGEVSAGQVVIVKVDYTFTHDAAGPLLINQVQKLKAGSLEGAKDRTIFFIDHAVPSPTKELSNDQATVRNFSMNNGMILSDAGNGICHQVMAEDYSSPGDLIVGTDSHTCTSGGLGAFATGMGATDIAVAMKLRKTWLRVPESLKVVANGTLPIGVYAKDLILKTLSLLGTDGATYKSIEFEGSAIDDLDVYGRLTLTNMAVEAGAKTGIVASDDRTLRYLKEFDRGEKWKELRADEGAIYESEVSINASDLEPQIALPSSPDNVKPVSEVKDVKVNEVFIGSCTNTRIEDMRTVAQIFKNQKKARGMKLIVTPSSQKVYLRCIQEGILETLLNAGAIVTPAGCGVCFGALGGIPADNDVIFSSSNRNFPGRTGNPKAQTYLGSPATAAATAITGIITDPRLYL